MCLLLLRVSLNGTYQSGIGLTSPLRCQTAGVLPGNLEQTPCGSVQSPMPTAQIDQPIPQKPLRLWPGVAAVLLQLLIRFGVPVVAPEATMFAVLGGLACGLAVVL